MATNERVFVVGASGDIGSGVVRGLVKKGIATTAYVRDEKKGASLFKDELNSGYLTIVAGTYTSIDVYSKAIQGHTRLFILVVADYKRPDFMGQVKQTFARIAYEQGVRQVVDLSSSSLEAAGKRGIIGYIHTTAEEKLWSLVEEKPDERSIAILRPACFMTNHFVTDLHNIKHLNKIISCGSSNSKMTWIDTKDISDTAVVILTEPPEKHERCVYEMGCQLLSNEDRTKIFSKILNRPITYEQVSMEQFYNHFMDLGLAHSEVYDFVTFYIEDRGNVLTPQLSLLLKRPLRTLEQWLEENIQAFQ